MKFKLHNIILAIFCLSSNISLATEGMKSKTLLFKSISALEFSPEGVLFIGDSIQGKVFAINLKDTTASQIVEPPEILNLENKIAALVGAKASDILIHDMAVHPSSKAVYMSVSRGRSNWNSRWNMPNDLDNASILIKVNNDSSIELIDFSKLSYTQANIPNPINKLIKYSNKGPLRGVNKRVNAITGIAYNNNKIYVSGLSNEDFASSLWAFNFPFNAKVSATTLEIFHGAHDRFETHSPIRALLPYKVNNKLQLLAAYLCTPVVLIDLDSLNDNNHIKGKTIGEIGDANIPIDMVAFSYAGEEKVVMSNTQMPLMTFKKSDIESIKTSLNTADDIYSLGLKYQDLPRGGIQQIDDFNEQFIIATKRLGGGKLSLVSIKKSWLY
jgi:hypothetical protein